MPPPRMPEKIFIDSTLIDSVYETPEKTVTSP
jgi:hypothetical protein